MRRIYPLKLVALSLVGLIVSMPGGVASDQRADQILMRQSSALTGDTLFIDGAQQFQTLDGFGVNANGASWDNGNLAPALDLLADTMQVKVWRVILEKADWEVTNDNADPNTFNWDYYSSIYESPKFQSLWSIIAYLNGKGPNQVMLNVMGTVPAWMGDGVINQEAEDEWVELIASAVYYGRMVKGLDFRLLSPTNEIDIGPPEGPRIDPTQYARLLNKLALRLQAVGLADMSLIPPDIAIVQQASAYLAPLFADATIMARVNHFSFHDYGGNSGDADSLIKASAYPDRNFWMTEFSAGCGGCDSGSQHPDQWWFGLSTVDLLLRHLDQGAASAFVYEAYDSYYEHHGSFSHWGMLAYDQTTHTYTPTTRFYAIAQVFRFTQPGMVRIGAATSHSDLQVAAFKDPATGAVTIVGRNPTGNAITINGTLANLPTTGTLAFYQTTQSLNLSRGADVVVTAGLFSVQIVPGSVFTLSNLTPGSPIDTQPPSVALTAPPNNATVSGASVPVAASASDTVAVTSVQFLLDGAPLGTPISNAPYALTWDTTSAPDGIHTLGAQARDAAGNMGFAAPVSVTVANGGGAAPIVLVGHTAVESNLDENPAGMAEAFQYNAIASGAVNQISVYLDGSSTATKVVIGLYADASDQPGSLLTQGTVLDPTPGTWNTAWVPAATVTAGTKYWIALLGPDDAGIVRLRDVVSGGKSQTSAQQDLISLPTVWIPGTNYASSPMSAYAVQLVTDHRHRLFLPLLMRLSQHPTLLVPNERCR